MNKIILLFICYFPSLYLHAQSTHELNGKVVDEYSKQPIQHVSVQVQGTLQGAITDENGKFKISYSQDEIILILSSIGYEKKLYQLKEIPKKELVFSLVLKADTLQTTIVQASKKSKKTKPFLNSLVDYNFYGDNILALSYIKNGTSPIKT